MDESTVQRLITNALEDEREAGKPITERARQSARSVEAYLKAGVRPRWMERLSEIERGMRSERQRLERSYRMIRETAGPDFAERWRAYAHEQRFEHLNQLIRQHNEWYPIERDLPMDPRTGEYIKILGRSHHRRELGPDWVLESFPAA